MATPSRFPWRPPAACAAGVFIGVMYTLSPMTAWAGLAIAGLFAWAGYDLTGRERRWVFGVLSMGVALRLLALVVFFLVTQRFDGSFPALILDENYIVRRSTVVSNIALGIAIEPTDYTEVTLPYAESGLLYVLAYVDSQLGFSPYGVRLLNVSFYLGACVALYRTVRRAFGASASLAGLAIVLFMPSMFIWSISVLKEPIYLFLTAVSVSAAVGVLSRPTTSGRVVAALICGGAVLAVGTIRTGGHLMVGGGIVGGLAVAALLRRPRVLATALVLATVIIGWAVSVPRVQAIGAELLATSIRTHVGHVKSPGWAYKLLDPELYAEDWATFKATPLAQARYVVRAIASVALVPLPWQPASPSAVAYLAEHVVWWVVMALAVIGSFAGLRRHPPLTLMLVGIVILTGAAIAFTSGNVGTLVRHRVMMLMPLAWLGGLGASTVMTLAARHPADGKPPAVESLGG